MIEHLLLDDFLRFLFVLTDDLLDLLLRRETAPED